MTEPAGSEGAAGRADREAVGTAPARAGGVFSALGVLLILASLPFLVLALGAMTGIGLAQNVPGQLAILGAVAIVVLPAIGLAAALGGHSISYGAALLGVSVAVVWALPSYFPEQRDEATRIGFAYFSRSFGDGAQQGAQSLALALLRPFGPEPSAPLIVAAKSVPEMPADETAERSPREDSPNATWIPYEGEGQTIIIPAHVDGPDFGEELRFVFDTGATLTTISADVLDLLDVRIPDDAPEVMLRTAAGEMKARLVLVDAIWLKQQVVEWVTVAVCEHCASDKADGLLGLNVSSHFRVSIDHEAGELEWVPRTGRRNRRLDVQPWLDMNSVLRRWDDGRLELEVRVENRAQQAIKRSVLEVKCSDEQFTIHLDPIPAKGAVTQMASLPWGVRCESFEVTPIAAAWETDRF